MNRRILSLDRKKTEAGPPPAPSLEAPAGQLLTFIVIDHKPFHHATYASAAAERGRLMEIEKPRDERDEQTKRRFRVMKVLNQSGAQLEGKVVIADGDALDPVALDMATLAASAAILHDEPSATVAERVIRAYLDALK
jgi:hypothetical protein